MRTFNNLKRDFRGLYRQKNKTMRRGRAQTLDNGRTWATDGDSALPSISVEPAGDAEVARPATAPANQAKQFAQTASDQHRGMMPEDREAGSGGDDGDLRMDDRSDFKRPLSVMTGVEEPAEQAGESVQVIPIQHAEAVVPAEKVNSCSDGSASQTRAGSDNGEPISAAEDIPEPDDNSTQEPITEEDNEEAAAWTPEEAQSVRDQVYVTFNVEEESDYTCGPARFIQTADGVQNCVALLMTFELSQAIQEAVHGQREYQRVETAGMFHRQSLLRLEHQVRRQIASCNGKLAIVEEENRLKSEDARGLQRQLETLELMLTDVQGRRKTVHTDVEVQARQLRSLQATVNAHLEEAFVCAQLLAQAEEEPEPETEELDMAQEYEAFCHKLSTAHDEPFEAAAPPLDMTREHLQVAPPSEEEQARQNIINALWASKETLDQAHRDFEEREVQRARELNANMVAADNGEATTNDSPEAFDVRWVLRYRELTRALIEAETAYAETKRVAFEAGVPLPFVDNETVCQAMDENDDGLGYTISHEQEMVASAPSPIVRRWLAKVPEGVEVGSPSFGSSEIRFEGDDWEAEEVEISDSRSMLAEGRERARIDRWRKACGDAKDE
jgi:hypothetical protein